MSTVPPGAHALSPQSADLAPTIAQLRERGEGWRPLDGKIFALISSSEESEDAQRFRRAATGLGARVAWMRPSLGRESGQELVRATSRVLGKLYDAIECQGLDAGLVTLVRESAGVPVFDALAATASETLDPADEAGRQLQLQARLLRSLT